MAKIIITIILLNIEISVINHDYSSLGQTYLSFLLFFFFNKHYVNNALVIVNKMIMKINLLFKVSFFQ